MRVGDEDAIRDEELDDHHAEEVASVGLLKRDVLRPIGSCKTLMFRRKLIYRCCVSGPGATIPN